MIKDSNKHLNEFTEDRSKLLNESQESMIKN